MTTITNKRFGKIEEKTLQCSDQHCREWSVWH